MMLNRCTECGQGLAPGVAFCTACGTRVATPPQAMAPCPRCGLPVESGVTYCRNCGSPIAPAPSPGAGWSGQTTPAAGGWDQSAPQPWPPPPAGGAVPPAWAPVNTGQPPAPVAQQWGQPVSGPAGQVAPPGQPGWPAGGVAAGGWQSAGAGAAWSPTPGIIAPVRPYASAAARATIASVALGIVALAAIGVAIGRLSEIQLLDRVLAFDRSVTEQQLDDNDNLQAGLLFLLVVVQFLAAIPFLMWIHRVARNLPALGARGTQFSPGWAVGWWFIPFANLVQPLRALTEIWKGSDPAPGGTDPQSRRARPVTPLLLIWWAAWIGSNILYSVALTRRDQALDEAEQGTGLVQAVDALDRVQTMDGLIAGAMAVQVAAIVLAIIVVRSLTGRQDYKARVLQAAAPGWRGV